MSASSPGNLTLSPPPFIGALLGAEKGTLLLELVAGLDPTALHWLSGYAAGLAARPGAVSTAASVAMAPTATPAAPLTIVYGTQTGNSRLIAERLKHQTESAGLPVRIIRASEYPVRELAREKLLAVVISTQGDGDPPDDARGFCEHLLGKRAPRLEGLSYAVLGLGDTSYPKFCEVGRALDARLAELGATRLVERADCDLDFEPIATGWLDQTLGRAREALEPRTPSVATIVPLRGATATPTVGKEAPFSATVLVNQRITGRGALKDVRHVEISLEGSGLEYAPGDALGVWAPNPPELVDAVLRQQRLDGAEPVTRDGKTLPLAVWLSEGLELTRLSRPFLERHATLGASTALQSVLTPTGAEAFRALLKSHQVIDVLRQHPAPWSAKELVLALRKQTPRLYSIASSPKRVGEEAHLTVAVVDYTAFGERHLGAASSHLSTRGADADSVRVFVERNERFRLPEDTDRDVVMIGPGTGVAPFRAFVQERAEVGARGRNWLFFGEQHFRSQFLYQSEWQEALKKKTLHKLSLAFSRDTAAKVYVQHRLREAGKELYTWLEGGAHLYVCGDAQRMAPDVHAALVDVIAEHGGRGREDAEDWLKTLRDERRYLRDVY
ncbi:assimilatory sulfite reductase (NADPH) flavoprotein subunit [Myxococcus llanfairpwllgwyngyllgogerychwyrndrobwllllantysiliogogogochensis]|uniref:assimilatory sulfite reductase (NADPH) n=1 Tax=Myxococcus llanfairpwllgwyngyllgogerychwyrndrobwllllantysiliogogogochensis TaxID=2590453 RepID=A0A540WXD9_9BACT|nr:MULTISPECIES: assimilatory sulfite reductase (NADPH) flavoprotein subunit [Myxococcus]NTX39465.1 assimilatory sulfite reductase (NADPH) flavoprotein subunit [Myxococcus sp. CA033]TQF13676.1 assimilatory sulfite reductase (NADPH) flavoprotein subunit [Myxococcus llanfairpwllgwyngyllgogerychwyrndrobwllllantysiliogogogochensis]